MERAAGDALATLRRLYARANASLGINGAVLTNVNANAQVLTAAYLDKVAALADVFRPYGIAVYLTARFSAPIEIGGLSTADPANSSVQQWCGPRRRRSTTGSRTSAASS
jgi:alpha-glucuronidase